MSALVPPVQCPVCHSMVPSTDRFCRRCGAPLWGRVFAPVQVLPAQYGQHTHRSRLPLLAFALAFVILLGGLGGVVTAVALQTRTQEPTFHCAVACHPLGGPPQTLEARYTDPTYGYSFIPDATAQVTGQGGGMTQITFNDGSAISPSTTYVVVRKGSTQDLSGVIDAEATSLGNNTLIQMQRLYDISGANIGQINGQASVYDAYLQAGNGTAQHVRVAIVAASHNGYTAVVTLLAPYTTAEVPTSIGSPQAADLVLLTFTWPAAAS